MLNITGQEPTPGNVATYYREVLGWRGYRPNDARQKVAFDFGLPMLEADRLLEAGGAYQ